MLFDILNLLNGCVDWVFIFRHGVHRLPNTLVYLLVPGNNTYLSLAIHLDFITVSCRMHIINLSDKNNFSGLFSNHGPLYFVDTKTKFSKMGLACHIAKIHSEVIIKYSLVCCM